MQVQIPSSADAEDHGDLQVSERTGCLFFCGDVLPNQLLYVPVVIVF